MKPTIKQFKLTNDDEIICEVLEWDNEENTAILLRGALRLVEAEDLDKGLRFYAFRPWMGFNESPDTLLTLNAAHIIGEITPSESITKYYMNTIAKTKRLLERRPQDLDLDELSDLDEDELEEYLESIIHDEDSIDSDLGDNVFRFKPKGTMH